MVSSVIIDTSALIAILRNEPEALACAKPIAGARSRRVSAVSFVEAAVVIDASRDPIASQRLDELVREAAIAIEPVTQLHARLAREAYKRFGRGSGHAAKLNFGDCFAYALATQAAEPLLFKGEAFKHTDLVCALDQ
jgi:ribonuclease VapC